MSLNCAEIDLVLSELDIGGAQIQRIVQPSFDTIVLGLYRPGASTDLLISTASAGCRIHRVTRKLPRSERPLRFAECLRARILDGRIESVAQIGRDRVIRFEIRRTVRDDEETRPGDQDRIRATLQYRLYARLWSGAGNILLVDESGTIVDALARRPARNEVSGAVCTIEEELAAGKPSHRIFAIRELPGTGSFNERVETLYNERGAPISRERLIQLARERFAKRTASLEARIHDLERIAGEYRDADRFREIGDILGSLPPETMAGSIGSGREFVRTEDFYRGGIVDIRLPEPGRSLRENAVAYYEKYRKASSGLGDVERECIHLRGELERLAAGLAAIEAEPDAYRIARTMERFGVPRTEPVRSPGKRDIPGIVFELSGWTVIVGRSARENDELLRRHVRGLDLWMHARDRAGSYVFIRNRPGKTVPLEVLVDAGMLALYYSKARDLGRGDLYYTRVKYLRRAKDGPPGLVVPTQEKNIFVEIDPARLASIKDAGGAGE